MKTKATDIFYLDLPRKWEVLLFVLIFALAVFLRLYLLSADSPNGISFSQGIETDPPQYTIYSRSAELTGEWNPYNDHRYVTYQYSLVSGVSRIVYNLFSVSFYSANLSAVILSLLSLFLFYLVLRKSLGSGVAILALFFISINYLGIFFGRRPFLENGMTFLFILSLFFLTYLEDKAWGHYLFGLALGAAVVFGKIIGLAFLGVPAVYYLLRFFYLRDGKAIVFSAIWAAGFGSIVGLWYKIIFLPHAESVSGYVGEQALGLYGTPEGLRSLNNFFWKFLVFGIDSEFFERMPAIGIAAVLGLIILAARLWPNKTDQTTARYRNLILISIAVWLIGTYLAQMLWNYQPVRYQTTMIFPLGALAAILIVRLYNIKDRFNIFNYSIMFNVIAFCLMMLLSYQLAAAIVARFGFNLYYNNHVPYILALVLPLTLIYFIVACRKKEFEFALPPTARYYLIFLLILTSAAVQGKSYFVWAETPLFTTRQASRDLGRVLAPGAVIAGPYAPALVLENNLDCIIHIFGTSRPDSTLFSRLPITHLALERSNEKVARELYPEIMDKARLVCHYYINCRKISIYRIAYQTGNISAGNYFPSNYETAIRAYQLNMPDTGRVYLDRFQKINTDNQSGNMQDGFFAFRRGDYDRAIEFFDRAARFSPTDFNLHYLLGRAYIAKADKNDDQSLRQIGESETDLATIYNLGYHDFDDHLMDDMFEDEPHGKADGQE